MPLLLCDADLDGDLRPLAEAGRRPRRRRLRRAAGRRLRAREAHGPRARPRSASGCAAREPLSGQRVLSPAAREACFPLAAGFGCEVAATIDAAARGPARGGGRAAARAPRDRPRSRRASSTAGASSLDALLACGPTRRQPPRPAAAARRLARRRCAAARRSPPSPRSASPTTSGAAPSAASAPTSAAAARPACSSSSAFPPSPSPPPARSRAALLVALSANALNQLDTRPGRALKAYLLAAAVVRRAASAWPSCLLPYDLREMGMLGDAGSNALGALLGLSSVDRLTGRGRWIAIGALAGLTVLGETRSLGAPDRAHARCSARSTGSAGARREPDDRRSTSSSPAASSRRSARASSPPRSAAC